MNKHSIVKTALGVGLMAASLTASAGALHSFTTPMMYYKVDGAKVYYTAFIPSGVGVGGFQGAGGVVVLDLYASGTVSSWNYGIGAAATAAAANAGAAWSLMAAQTSVKVVGYPVTSTSVTNASFASDFFSFGDTQSVTLQFVSTPVISSQACNVTFTASINSDDYLVFSGFVAQPSGWPTTGAGSVKYRTVSGTATSDTASYVSSDWNASNFSVSRAFSTFGAYTFVSGAAYSDSVSTFAASSLTKANLCVGAVTAKTALNSSGTTIGGKAGMMRLW